MTHRMFTIWSLVPLPFLKPAWTSESSRFTYCWSLAWRILSIQGNLKSLLQYHSSKTSILWHSAFFMVQFSHPYMTTGKNIALTRRIFVGKVMSLSKFVIAFLPRSKHLLISWLQSICGYFGAQENSLSLSPLFPYLFAMKWWDRMPWFSFVNAEF